MAPHEQKLAALRAKHTEWEAAWQRLQQDADEGILYHYTDAQGLLGIIESQELWASHAAFLNDSTELTYTRGVLSAVTEQFRNDFRVTAPILDYAVDAFAATEKYPANERRTAAVISILESTSTMAADMFDVYVSCFCEHGDLLSQWRGYPSSGGGYALGLRSEAIRRRGTLLRVIYDEATQRRLLHDLLAPVVEAVASQPNEERDIWDVLGTEHLARVAMSLQKCSFCFKHPGFAEESEWRLVMLSNHDANAHTDEHRPDVRPIRTGLLPYLKLPLDIDAVAKIVVGPSSHPSLAADAARLLLRNAGHDREAHGMVTHSTIPLRV